MFFFNDTATTEIYTLSLHDALPILWKILTNYERHPEFVPDLKRTRVLSRTGNRAVLEQSGQARFLFFKRRSEEHTSELQSRQYLVCRLLLEKKKNRYSPYILLIAY